MHRATFVRSTKIGHTLRVLPPSELDAHTPPPPLHRKPPPRGFWWWQTRYWHVLGCSLLVLAVIATHESWRVWIGPFLYSGLTASLWGYSGVPVRELPLRYRLAQIALLPALIVPMVSAQNEERLTASCFVQPGQPLIAYFAADARLPAVAFVIDYGDGKVFTGTRQDGIKHVYAKPGTYHARITIVERDKALSDTCTVTVT